MISAVLIIVIIALIIALIASNWESITIPARKGFIEDENGVNQHPRDGIQTRGRQELRSSARRAFWQGWPLHLGRFFAREVGFLE
jgi:hypothetical protein